MSQTTSPADYSAFRESPKEAAFASLAKLVEASRATEQKLEELGIAMQLAQEQLRELNWRQIPEKMSELGLKEFKDNNGLCITIKEQVEAGISQANCEAAHQWLDVNGHSGLMKRQVIVSFNKDQTAQALALSQELAAKFAGVQQKRTVHAQTLKAWAREMLAEGRDFPLELFGVFTRRVAQINSSK